MPLDGTYSIKQVEVVGPGGKKSPAPVRDGHATFYAGKVGVHRINITGSDAKVASIDLAANLTNPAESDIAPSTELNLGGRTIPVPDEFTPSHQQSIWTYLILLVLGLLAVEWPHLQTEGLRYEVGLSATPPSPLQRHRCRRQRT